MPTPSDLVTDAFAQARAYAAAAETKLASFITAMNGAVQLAPAVDLTFNTITPPNAATVPDYTQPTDYSSSLLVSLAAGLATRLAGGTGLEPSVEAALWDRAREREGATAQAAIDQVSRDSEALGYELPSGVLTDSIRRETRAYFDKVSSLSRDIAIEQAKLEQANMQKAIDQCIAFESALAELIAKRQSISLDAFKADILRFQSEVEQEVKYWEGQVKQYEAQVSYMLNGQKINSDITRSNLAIILEAGKIGAQVYAQLTSSAYSLIHAQASVSGTAGTQVSYSYNNSTSSSPPSITAI